MKYMIHSCNDRKWYVEKYLIPSMIKQGINKDDIILWNDDNCVGNLKSWLESCKWIQDNLDVGDGVWHLQDDVVISSQFKNYSLELPHYADIVAGFCTYEFNKERYHIWHRVPITFIWMTFPCIYIPVKYTNEFLFWFEMEVIKGKKYKTEYATGKMDDFFFNRYIKTIHPEIYVYNTNPNMVDHIDFALGGSTINAKEHKKKINRAYWWYEEETTQDMLNKIKEERDGN